MTSQPRTTRLRRPCSAIALRDGESASSVAKAMADKSPRRENQERRTISGLRPPSSVFTGLSSVVRCRVSLFTVCRPAFSVPGSDVPTLHAFTLIELLVVIVVIAILMGITLPVSKYAIRRAKAARQEVMLAKIRSALDDYRAAYGEYPITPITNAAGTQPKNYSDAIRHYPDNYPTECYYTTNSRYTNVYLTSSGTVENIMGYKVDYCLTYPLMLKQADKGVRPFYAFPEGTVISLVYKRFAGDEWSRRVRIKGGEIRTLVGLYGRQINRPKAADPVSMKQWKYTCYDGVSYAITTNTFQ